MSWSTLMTILFAAFRVGWASLDTIDFPSWQITIRLTGTVSETEEITITGPLFPIDGYWVIHR